ncbi:LppU/SCO3897 family protein [Kribbella sp. CA-247076]|uniref:LppU/SCO3897 family protein n=1 Tax=Kribbella sp. CA-247076 TaxID=3239941 RepID=UPI003D8F2DD0
MTTSPPQPPQNPYPGHPGGYGPPPEQFPQYAQPQAQPAGPPQSYEQPPQPFQQAPNQPHQPTQPFPQPGSPYQQPGQHQQPMPQNVLQCRFCGAFPAEQATVRGHQGMIVVMRFLKLQGPFCKTCGIATVREMTAKSMLQGWWGIGSMIVNPITMLMNLEPWAKFRKLPDPAPGAPGRPMDPGKPLFRRPAVLMLLLPIALITAIVVINLSTTTASEAEVGACVVNKGTAVSPNVEVVDCASSEAEYKVVGKLDGTVDDSRCDQFPGYEAAYTSEVGSQKYTLCLGPI